MELKPNLKRLQMEKGEVSGRSHTHTHTFIRDDTHKQPCVCSPSLDLLCIYRLYNILVQIPTAERLA